jgi:hypothetical protein
VPERFCKNCKNKVEDEKPFILYCPLYKNLRNKYIINEESQFDNYLISRNLNPVNVTDAKNVCIFAERILFLQNLSGTGNGGFIYLPVSIASWWALILILVMRDLLKLGRSKLMYFC